MAICLQVLQLKQTDIPSNGSKCYNKLEVQTEAVTKKMIETEIIHSDGRLVQRNTYGVARLDRFEWSSLQRSNIYHIQTKNMKQQHIMRNIMAKTLQTILKIWKKKRPNNQFPEWQIYWDFLCSWCQPIKTLPTWRIGKGNFLQRCCLEVTSRLRTGSWADFRRYIC